METDLRGAVKLCIIFFWFYLLFVCRLRISYHRLGSLVRNTKQIFKLMKWRERERKIEEMKCTIWEMFTAWYRHSTPSLLRYICLLSIRRYFRLSCKFQCVQLMMPIACVRMERGLLRLILFEFKLTRISLGSGDHEHERNSITRDAKLVCN